MDDFWSCGSRVVQEGWPGHLHSTPEQRAGLVTAHSGVLRGGLTKRQTDGGGHVDHHIDIFCGVRIASDSGFSQIVTPAATHCWLCSTRGLGTNAGHCATNQLCHSTQAFFSGTDKRSTEEQTCPHKCMESQIE
jgi:hypothetical protein